MPRRQTPLDPLDGPGARFSLALRQLRDDLGRHAPSFAALAEKSGVSRAATYAAFSGRVPQWETVDALVTVLRGDRDAWYRIWREAETSINLEGRHQRRMVSIAATPSGRVSDDPAPSVPETALPRFFDSEGRQLRPLDPGVQRQERTEQQPPRGTETRSPAEIREKIEQDPSVLSFRDEMTQRFHQSGLTFRQLGEVSNMSKTTAHRAIAGPGLPSRKIASALIHAMGGDPSLILSAWFDAERAVNQIRHTRPLGPVL